MVDHLFRHETGKLIAVLTRVFGAHNLQLAEDVVQDALLEAMNVWSYKGVPENATGWLYKVAKNKALNIANREQYSRVYTAAAVHLLRTETDTNKALDHLFSETEIQDDQLRMMFTCCHPSISPDSQVALILRTLCGFSIPEIARAFLTTEENINKRLVRARQKIRDEQVSFEIPEDANLEQRLNAVLEAIYLLFNEGYSASTGDELIRYELCEEAIRLAGIIAASPLLHDKYNVHACLALMYLNASRFKARVGSKGEMLTMAEQDRSLWNRDMIQAGLSHLDKAKAGGKIAAYHILAGISGHHCIAPSFAATDWKGILSLYDKMLQVDDSPVVLLNRAIAVSKVHGEQQAIAELDQLADNPVMKSYHLYYSTLAEFHMQLAQYSEAIRAFGTAMELAPLQTEKEFLARKIETCRTNMNYIV